MQRGGKAGVKDDHRNFPWYRGMPIAVIAIIAILSILAYVRIDLRAEAIADNEGSGLLTTGSLGIISHDNQSQDHLKLPRFVSLKSDRVNVRRGPSSDHAIAWVYNRKKLPVEIIAEFEHWRRVRDSDGEEGWVYQSLLSGHRTAIVAPWIKGKTVRMLRDPETQASVVALLGPGVIGDVESCLGTWCRLNIEGHEGWIDQAMLWGVYPGEHVQN